MKKQRAGFTLIELLVVIAIIGILSTLAVVALQNARKSARDVKRLADVRQIQTALELYLNDWGTYPPPDENNSLGESIATGGVTYMARVPTTPTPIDGDLCVAFFDAFIQFIPNLSPNIYYYELEDNEYSIVLCLGGPNWRSSTWASIS